MMLNPLSHTSEGTNESLINKITIWVKMKAKNNLYWPIQLKLVEQTTPQIFTIAYHLLSAVNANWENLRNVFKTQLY